MKRILGAGIRSNWNPAKIAAQQTKKPSSHLKTPDVDSVVEEGVDGVVVGADEGLVGREVTDLHGVADLLLDLVSYDFAATYKFKKILV